jgi:phosphoglycerate dehydrogenase-like enzyme
MADPIGVLVTVPFEPRQIEGLRDISADLEFHLHPLSPGDEFPAELAAETQVLYTFRTLPRPEQAPQLRWIQFHSAGVEEHLDAPILQTGEVQATTLSGANAPQVAEHALALLLALSHQVHTMLADQTLAKWPTQRGEKYQQKELRGTTVGIVGYGSIGQNLARLLQPFDVKILASRRDLRSNAGPGYQAGASDANGELVQRMYPGEALATMFKECEFIVVTVPLTKRTRGLIAEKQLAASKPGAILVDVSRGGVVDHAALVKALERRQLGGAALDVFPEEPLPADNPLWHLPNVIISPHVAGFSPKYNERALDLFRENLRRYVQKQELLNKIDLERGY